MNTPRGSYRFERAVSERNYGGLGLGLYVTRRVIDAMGGTVRAQSTPGQGVLFVVELPRQTSKHSRGARVPPSPVGGCGPPPWF